MTMRDPKTWPAPGKTPEANTTGDATLLPPSSLSAFVFLMLSETGQGAGIVGNENHSFT